MAGFDRIKLDSTAPLDTNSGSLEKKEKVSMSPRQKKKRLIILGTAIVLVVVLLLGVVIPAFATYKSAKKTYAQAQVALAALKEQNIEKASTELAKTKEDLSETQKNLDRMFILRFIPGPNFYYADAQHLAKAGSHYLDSAEVLVDAVKPYADVLGLKGEGSFTSGSAEQRIQTAVQTMSKITPKIDEIEKSVLLAREEIDKINPNRYPGFLGGEKVRNNLVQIRKLTDDGATFLSDAKPLVKLLPELLGEPEPKRYMIIFQNDKELRPTGGFITAYALFRLEHGVIKVERSSDIYDLDNTIGGKPKAPEPILKYLPKVPLFNLRDSNLSPDFEESMKTFSSMYEKAGAYEEIDGIIAIDTNAFIAAMNILGDIQAGGITFTTKIDERCNCPQAIYALEEYADKPVNYERENRKGIIGDLMFAILQKALSSSPKLYWGPLFQAMLTQTEQKHILFNLYNPDAQSGIRALNAAGKIQDFDGDYFHFNEANFGGAKANMFVQKTVKQDYDVKDDGSIEKTVTVAFKNPFPPSDCNLERGNLCLNAPLRNWVRVYVPKGSTLIDYKGSEVKMDTYEDLGKTVFEGFLIVRPLGSTTLTFTYKLPFKLESGSELPVLIQKQPGNSGDDYTLNFDGKRKEEFKLLTDRKFVF